jgi:hypothetical protein
MEPIHHALGNRLLAGAMLVPGEVRRQAPGAGEHRPPSARWWVHVSTCVNGQRGHALAANAAHIYGTLLDRTECFRDWVIMVDDQLHPRGPCAAQLHPGARRQPIAAHCGIARTEGARPAVRWGRVGTQTRCERAAAACRHCHWRASTSTLPGRGPVLFRLSGLQSGGEHG